MNKKIISYIHFSIKKGAVKLGLEEVVKSASKIKLVIYSSELKESSFKKLIAFCESNNIKHICLTEEIDGVLVQKNAKVIGITDESLSKAIIENINIW